MKEKILLKKDYTVKKGQEDYRIWCRANDYLFKLMESKRRNIHIIRTLKKPITIKIEVIETFK